MSKRNYINGLIFDLATYQRMIRTNERLFLGDELSLEEIKERAEEIQNEVTHIEADPNYKPWAYESVRATS